MSNLLLQFLFQKTRRPGGQKVSLNRREDTPADASSLNREESLLDVLEQAGKLENSLNQEQRLLNRREEVKYP